MMMRIYSPLLSLIAVAISQFSLPGLADTPAASNPVTWDALPPIPDAHGFAGPFAGMIGGDLIVAGGANFPKAPPWEGGDKVWHDRVFLLSAGADDWVISDFRLPRALAYGVSITLPDRGSIAMLGGSDSTNAPTTSAIELHYSKGEIRADPLPDLPIPLTESSGIALGNSLYLFSGRTTEGAAQKAYRIDLDADSPSWEELPWPKGARGRMHSVAGTHKGKLYLFAGRDDMSGTAIDHPEDRMEPHKLDFLRDAYRLDPISLQWSRLADLPQGLSAAPSHAVSGGGANLIILGGVDVGFLKKQIAARPDLNGQGHEHPGFPRSIWDYDTDSDTWAKAGELPAGIAAPVTVPVVPTKTGSFIIPSGEIKPGIRTTQVVEGTIKIK